MRHLPVLLAALVTLGQPLSAETSEPPPDAAGFFEDFALHGLLRRFGIKRSEVKALGFPARYGREMLASETMRPAEATARLPDPAALIALLTALAAALAAIPCAVLTPPSS